MAKIRRLERVLEENPAFRPNWSNLESKLPDGRRLFTGFKNTGIGKVERVVVCRDDGTPIYDTYQIMEGPQDEAAAAAVIVPYFFRKGEIHVGMLCRLREAVADPKTGNQGKYISSELPRGFRNAKEKIEDAARRELGEETGMRAGRLSFLGKLNTNTALMASSIEVFAAEVNPSDKSKMERDDNEPISGFEFLPYKEVRKKASKNIICGITLASLLLFDLFLESSDKQDDRYAFVFCLHGKYFLKSEYIASKT
ncbi:MAG: NUDIX domain-containing protein [Candidatus Aenigmarchaeota archaeon]|nr:NUDIX domain-containing protein [Candidatus Aenigmarchaeota archaeon]